MRDRIIITYKEEIKMHTARERDFKTLQDSLGDLERRIKLMDAEI